MSARFLSLREVSMLSGIAVEDLWLDAAGRRHGWRWVRKAWRIAPAKLRKHYGLSVSEFSPSGLDVSRAPRPRSAAAPSGLRRVASLLDELD